MNNKKECALVCAQGLSLQAGRGRREAAGPGVARPPLGRGLGSGCQGGRGVLNEVISPGVTVTGRVPHRGGRI